MGLDFGGFGGVERGRRIVIWHVHEATVPLKRNWELSLASSRKEQGKEIVTHIVFVVGHFE